MKSQIKAIVLIQAGGRDKVEIQRERKNEHPGMNAEMTITSAFTLIIFSLNARRTQVAEKLLSIHP